jgi:hypothetical protein
MNRPATNKAKKFLKGFKDWNEKRMFKKLSTKDQLIYIKKLFKQ